MLSRYIPCRDWLLVFSRHGRRRRCNNNIPPRIYYIIHTRACVGVYTHTHTHVHSEYVQCTLKYGVYTVNVYRT